MVRVAGVGVLNVERTEQLLWGVYHGDTAARVRPHGWIDAPSANVLNLYARSYAMMSMAVQDTNPALAARAAQMANAILANHPAYRAPGD